MREGTKVGRKTGGVTSLEGTSREPELAIYLCTYLRTSFHCIGTNNLRSCSALTLHEQTRIAATKLLLTAVILSSSETSGPLSNLYQ